MNARFLFTTGLAVALVQAACVGVPTDLSTDADPDRIADLLDTSANYVRQAFHCSVDLNRESPLQCAPVGSESEAALIVGGPLGAYIDFDYEGWEDDVDNDGNADEIVTLKNVTIINKMIQKILDYTTRNAARPTASPMKAPASTSRFPPSPPSPIRTGRPSSSVG